MMGARRWGDQQWPTTGGADDRVDRAVAVEAAVLAVVGAPVVEREAPPAVEPVEPVEPVAVRIADGAARRMVPAAA